MRSAIRPRHLQESTKTVSGVPAHPLVYDYTWRASRYRFLEFVVALHRFKPQRLARRVRNRFEYIGFQAEMLAGLAVASTGATMQHEPYGREGSIDWLATWPTSERLFLEVKCPQTSKRNRVLEWVTTHFHRAMMERFHSHSCITADTGTWIMIDLAEDFAREVASRGLVNDDAVAHHAAFDELARQAMAGIEALRWPLPNGSYSIGRAGVIRVLRGAGAEPKFHFGGNVPVDDQQEPLRLQADLEEAAAQLRRVGEPGVIVLDACCDWSLRIRVADVIEALDTEAWARDLAGVLLLDRKVNGTPDCLAIFVRGPRWKAALPMLNGLHTCEHDHFHAHSGVFPVPRCSGPSFL